MFQRIQEGEIKDLNIVVKADVQGTIEALRSSLQNIKNDEVKVVVVHAGVGAITESDVMLLILVCHAYWSHCFTPFKYIEILWDTLSLL